MRLEHDVDAVEAVLKVIYEHLGYIYIYIYANIEYPINI